MAVTSRREWRKKGHILRFAQRYRLYNKYSSWHNITGSMLNTALIITNNDIDFVIYSVPLSNGMVGFDLFTLYSWFLGCHRNEPGIVQTKLFRDIDVNFIFSAFFIPVTALLFGIVPWQQLLRMFVGQLSVNCGLSHRNDFGAKRGKLFLIYFLKN